MKIRIPYRVWVAYDRGMNWCASWLPPPKPIGLKIFGYEVTRLDVAVLVGGVLISIASGLWYQSWWWALIGFLTFIGSWIWLGLD
jgi:hypothetical protein